MRRPLRAAPCRLSNISGADRSIPSDTEPIAALAARAARALSSPRRIIRTTPRTCSLRAPAASAVLRRGRPGVLCTSGRLSTTRPSGPSPTGANPAARRPSSNLGMGSDEITTVGATRRSPRAWVRRDATTSESTAVSSQRR